MAQNGVKLSGSGLKHFIKFIGKGGKFYTKILRDEVRKATRRNLLLVEDEIKQQILKKKHEPNSAVTEAIKGENFPLKDTGDMVQAISTEMKSAYSGFVGFLKDQKTSHGGDMEKVVEILQEGFELEITPAMRKFLFATSEDPGPKPAVGTPGVIRVKGRPFVNDVFKDKKIIQMMNKNWEMAVASSLRRVKAIR